MLRLSGGESYGLSMFEVTDTGGDHGHSVSIAVVNSLLVADRAAGLDHCSDACLVGYFNTVGKREEGIGSHYSAIEVKPE